MTGVILLISDRPDPQFLGRDGADRVLAACRRRREPALRHAYLNGMIPSEQRATILSFDSLIGNAGGIVAQPALGRAADVWNYAVSYLFSAAVSALALPFLLRARPIRPTGDTAPPTDESARFSPAGRCATPRAAGRSELASAWVASSS